MLEDFKHRLIKISFVSYLGAKGNVSDNLFYHESWVMWDVEFLTQEYNIIECEFPMEERIEHWPCNPRISGLIPGSGNLKKLFVWMKIHGLTKNYKTLFRADVGQQ